MKNCLLINIVHCFKTLFEAKKYLKELEVSTKFLSLNFPVFSSSFACCVGARQCARSEKTEGESTREDMREGGREGGRCATNA